MMRRVSHAPSATHFFQIFQLCLAASSSVFPFQSAHNGGSGAADALQQSHFVTKLNVSGRFKSAASGQLSMTANTLGQPPTDGQGGRVQASTYDSNA